ncbi:PA1136 family autoinducer-binding transcriptional regulator [Salinisphaera sp. Q1T1-3]|uniref:PA1136 family autoinducer-binding transcriptional regulator n=1 Tax=Salinisphaera sp. Q1T1-3 TaxID=2321229 RepID=UPI000E73C351|nr:PA1136 family autoinducer-binding transcriptional regulator [Salinisphaera sp. Q1T1-3]RJS91493.1 LuxR family transcriptional regulator [Salinisphaera sp. Q1T1-3]
MTTGLADDALSVVLALEQATTLTAVEDAVRAYAAPLGYDRLVLFSATAAWDDVVDRIYWVEGNWNDDGAGVDARTYIRRCPMTRHILDARAPFFWRKIEQASGEQYQVTPAPRGDGVHGLQVPVFGPLGLEGAMSLGGEHINATATTRVGLTLVATTAFLAARRLLEAPRAETSKRLSNREQEVLSWTAAGHRQADVAATLGLSSRTIENHLRRIRHRLGATTTAQAIRIAIHNGDIEV